MARMLYFTILLAYQSKAKKKVGYMNIGCMYSARHVISMKTRPEGFFIYFPLQLVAALRLGNWVLLFS
jgi:hypothetical protein